jgi:outer membrane autotransporter protein
VSGNYGAVDQSQAGSGMKYRLAYTPHEVTVYTTPANYGNPAPFGVNPTSAQRQLGSVLTTLLPEPHARAANEIQAMLVNRLYPLSVPEIANTLDSIAGEGTDPTFVTAMNSRLFQQAIETRLQGQRSSSPVGGYAAAGDGASGPTFWGTALGGFGSGDYLRNADLSTGGVVFGADTNINNNLTAGGVLGYAQTRVSPGPGGNADVGSLEVAGYARWTDDAWFATGLAGFGYHWLDMDRAVKVGNRRETANSSPDGQGVFVAATAGRRIDVKHAVLEPTVGLNYDHVWRDSFKENGTAFANRQIDNENLDAAQASVGVRAYTEIELNNNTRLKPEINAGYAREIGSTAITSNASLMIAPGSSFTVVTEGPGRDVGMLGARLTGDYGSATFFLDYHVEMRSEFTGHVARAGVNINF